MDQSDIQNIFESNGGEFLTLPHKISKKLETTYGFLFDWDGVFNSGKKGTEFSSTFSEIDSVGINLLQFGFWLKYSRIPFIGIIADRISESALELTKREHYNAIYVSFKYRKDALHHIQETANIRPNQIAFVINDVLDLSAVELTGLSFLIGRKSSPLFRQYIKDKDLVDYISSQRGDLNAVREICELTLGLNGNFNEVLQERVAYGNAYQAFVEERAKIEPRFYHKVEKKIIETIL